MNGLEIKNMKTLNSLISILVISLINSCTHRVNCSSETDLFKTSWNETVKSTYRDQEHKATYIIETISGKKISIAPSQDIIFLAEYGDRIIKKPHCFETLLIKKVDKDTFECRLTSTTCDPIVLKDLGFTEDDFDYEQMRYIKKKG